MPTLPLHGHLPDRPTNHLAADRSRLHRLGTDGQAPAATTPPASAPVADRGAAPPEALPGEAAALRFLQRWQSLASQPIEATGLLQSPEQARAQVDRLQWQLAASPALALQAQGGLDPARVAQWLQR